MTLHWSPPWWPGMLRPGGWPLGWGPPGTACGLSTAAHRDCPGTSPSPCPALLGCRGFFCTHAPPLSGTHMLLTPKLICGHSGGGSTWQVLSPEMSPSGRWPRSLGAHLTPTPYSGGRSPQLPRMGRRLLPGSSLQTPLPRGAFLALSSV